MLATESCSSAPVLSCQGTRTLKTLARKALRWPEQPKTPWRLLRMLEMQPRISSETEERQDVRDVDLLGEFLP